MQRINTEVMVIGGGATGAGVARDLAMRGFKTVIVERGDWATGTTGRYNGLLHSGSRYSLKDMPTARECIQENRILRRIMPHCIEDIGAYAVATPEDDADFGEHLVNCCHEAGVPIEEVPVSRLLKEQPYVNPGIKRAFRLMDTPADSFLATRVNIDSARAYGAQAFNYHQVIELIVRDRTVAGAVCRNRMSGELVSIQADMVVNAAGAWAGQVAALAGIDLPIICSKGSMIAVHHRVTDAVVVRLRMPSDNDSVLPSHSICVLGCNDLIVDSPDETGTQPEEIAGILHDCSQLVPVVKNMRLMRVWAGVRPLLKTSGVNGDTGRELSRNHMVLDHQRADGVAGLVSIVGGKWTTYRLMAEQTVDEVCRKLDSPRPCRTHLEPLPGAENGTYHWQAAPLAEVEKSKGYGQLLCECELVPRSTVEETLQAGDVFTIDDLRRTTRLGMGTCQGGFCTYRAAGLLHRHRHAGPEETNGALLDFVQERWKGVRTIVSGNQLRQARLNELVLRQILAADQLPDSLVHSPNASLVDLEAVAENKTSPG